MTSKVIGKCLAAITCGTVLVLAGCGTDSTSGSQKSSGTTVAASAAVTSPAKADGGSSAPTPSPVDNTVTETTTAAQDPTTTSAAAAALWDPCSLAASDLTAAGLSAASKTRVPGTPPTQICHWQSADQSFELLIGASERPLADLMRPGTVKDIRNTEFYGRPLSLYRSVQDTNNLGCYIGTAASFGSIEFTVRHTKSQTDPCADSNKIGAKLFNSLPS
ncbi:DUF3558 family protein [Nocardia acidivorans]|uniref:DUF3558 family protein n=1 Tax=Nocardia acidivorans TaxID=404580 RepID=UPI000836D28B|nr:DUF3558 family protein [Nocardia acidivorans]